MITSSVMSRYIHTLLYLSFISASFQTAPITKRTFLFRNPVLDGRLVHNWTAVRASSRVWECAGICSADSDCMSVAFKPMSGECFTYQRILSTTDAFTNLASATVFGVCPVAYSVMGRRCVKVVSVKLDRDSAREHCTHDNADLITLESQAKTDEFRDFMEENGHGSDNYWCGASRVTGGWQWVNGVPISSNSWCHFVGNETSCGATINPPSTCLKYRSCRRSMSFVCELQF